MYRKLYVLLLPLMLACSTTQVTTTNIQNLASFEEKGSIYALPQTRLVYEVTAIKTTFTPGPFSKYAKKYLGIEGAEPVSNVYWELQNVNMQVMHEADPDHYYSVTGGTNLSLFNQLTMLQKDGLLILPSQQNDFQFYRSDIIEPVEKIHYTDLSIKSFYKEVDKKKKNTAIDSAFNRLPFEDDYVELKTTEEKAEEAAAYLFKMRKRRFKLMSGQYEVFPEGTALETAVREINALEQEYLSLFIGKTETDTVKRVFTITPDASEELQRKTLFRFSEETGFSQPNSGQGEPIVVEIYDLDKNNAISQLHMPEVATTYKNVVFYRIPDRANVKALYGSHILHESEVGVCQFGTLVPKYIAPVSTPMFGK